ncbi:MAG TPA: hypothetical protein VNO52_18165, partial [Methylomirabilota bacterium]|nr:hypothetical protein [Methylomirabilota bacterium]
IDPIADRVIVLGETLFLTVTAHDEDEPPQALAFDLVEGPTGSALTADGVFSWTPLPIQSPSTNRVTVRVTDDGTPPARGTRSFTVEVRPALRSTVVVTDDGLTLSFATIVGRTYQVEYKNDLKDAQWLPLGDPAVATSTSMSVSDTLGTRPHRFYRIVIVE